MSAHKVCIIGIGPGAQEYLLPIARREIENADCLIGARRTLSLFQDLNKETIYLEGNFSRIIPYIKEHRGKKKIAVLVSGDPGLYSFLGQIQLTFKREDYAVVPGISSLQLAFAKIGESWHDVKIISLHGRKSDTLIDEVRRNGKIFLFTDQKFPPERIAARLLSEGVSNRRAFVFEDISYPNERVVDTDLENLSKMKGFGLCAVVIKKQENSTE